MPERCLERLLALLALPHIGSRRALGIFEGVKHILVGPRFRWCQESVPNQLLTHIRPPPTWFLEVLHEEGVHPLAVSPPVGEVGVAVAGFLQQP